MKYVVIFFIICIILQPIAQILEKKGMAQVGKLESFGDIFKVSTLISIATNPYIIAGVFLAVISLLFWLATLSNWEVSRLYPLGSISYVLVLALAVLFLGESITVIKGLGVATIAIGVVLLNL